MLRRDMTILAIPTTPENLGGADFEIWYPDDFWVALNFVRKLARPQTQKRRQARFLPPIKAFFSGTSRLRTLRPTLGLVCPEHTPASEANFLSF